MSPIPLDPKDAEGPDPRAGESDRLHLKREIARRLAAAKESGGAGATAGAGGAPARSEDGWTLITRRLCLIKDTGHAGTLWGGTMMSWIDEAGAIYAGLKTANERMVTKHFGELDFVAPVKPGDFVDFYGRVIRPGSSSLTVEIRAVARRPESDEEWEVVTVSGVFVAVDAHLRKTRLRLKGG